jgi:hypothetical protein
MDWYISDNWKGKNIEEINQDMRSQGQTLYGCQCVYSLRNNIDFKKLPKDIVKDDEYRIRFGKEFNFIDKERRGVGFNSSEKNELLSICNIGIPHMCYMGELEISVLEMMFRCRHCPHANKEFEFYPKSEFDGIVEDKVRERDTKTYRLYQKLQKQNEQLKKQIDFLRLELGDIYSAAMKEFRRRVKND